MLWGMQYYGYDVRDLAIATQRFTGGQVFAEYVHNERNVARNHIVRFEARPNGASLDRVIVITTHASASASELVINGLKPFMPVVVVGDRTYGKGTEQVLYELHVGTFAGGDERAGRAAARLCPDWRRYSRWRRTPGAA